MEALVFSSEREGLSIAMLEGMAAGVPIVATRVGGTPELVDDGRTGLLVPPHAPAELATAIARVLEDDSLAAALACSARATIAARFSFEAMASAYEDLYRSSRRSATANALPSSAAPGAGDSTALPVSA